MSTIALILSSLGVGGLLGAYGKAVLDKRHLKFSKVFEFKEKRYQAMMILMWVAMNPSAYELEQLQSRRPEIKTIEELDRELQLEYHNAMLFASNRVLKSFATFIATKTPENWRAVTRAMNRDLYR